MADLLLSASRLAADTVAYLVAWWGVPVWAFAAAAALLWAGRDRRLDARARSERRPRRLLGAFLLAVARPFSRSRVRRHLRRLDGRTDATATYLAAGHGLTAYYFFLLGPLLGKDVLLSHVLGFVVFAALGGAFARLFGAGEAGPSGDPATPEEVGGGGKTRRPPDRGTAEAEDAGTGPVAGQPASPSGKGLVLGEGTRYVGWSAWGLAVGAVVGAAALADPSLFLTDLLPGEGFARQAIHAAAGLALAPLTLMAPVATLFAGTFLWKAGLAHAGLVAFFCAATLSPARLADYRRVWGAGRALRWTAALAAAAVAAGLIVAAAFGLGGLEIRYKLTPGQLWTP